MLLNEFERTYCFHEDELLTLVYDSKMHELTVTLVHGEEPNTQILILHFREVNDFYVDEYDQHTSDKRRHTDSIQHLNDSYTFILSSALEHDYLRLFCETTERGCSYYRDIFISAAEITAEISESDAN